MAYVRNGDTLEHGIRCISSHNSVIFATFILEDVPSPLSDRALADLCGFSWHDFDFLVERTQDPIGPGPIFATVKISKD